MPDSHNIQIRRAKSKVKRRNIAVVLSIALSASLCGCSSLRSIASTGAWNDTVETLRNKSYSAKAWFRRKSNFGDMQYSRDFQAGFRAGYEDIADGKPGCPPTFPPKEYWGWEFQSVQGKGRIAAWLEGYPYGVQAARDEGVGQWNHLFGGSGSGCGQCGSSTCGGNCGTGQAVTGYPTDVQLGDQIYQGDVRGSYQVIPDQNGTGVTPGTGIGSGSVTTPGFPIPEVQSPTPFPITN